METRNRKIFICSEERQEKSENTQTIEEDTEKLMEMEEQKEAKKEIEIKSYFEAMIQWMKEEKEKDKKVIKEEKEQDKKEMQEMIKQIMEEHDKKFQEFKEENNCKIRVVDDKVEQIKQKVEGSLNRVEQMDINIRRNDKQYGKIFMEFDQRIVEQNEKIKGNNIEIMEIKDEIRRNSQERFQGTTKLPEINDINKEVKKTETNDMSKELIMNMEMMCQNIHGPCDGMKFYGDSRVNPNMFVKNLEQGIGKIKDINRVKGIIRKTMNEEAEIWFSMIEQDIQSFEEFKFAFLNRYWGRIEQSKVRRMIMHGKYKGYERSRECYATKIISQVKQLSPPMEEEEIIYYIGEHFEEDINRRIGLENIRTIEELMVLLKHLDQTVKFIKDGYVQYGSYGDGWKKYDYQRQEPFRNNYRPEQDNGRRNNSYRDRDGRYQEGRQVNYGNNYNKPNQNLDWHKRREVHDENNKKEWERTEKDDKYERKMYQNYNINRGRGTFRGRGALSAGRERKYERHINNVNVEIKEGNEELSAESDQEEIKVDNTKYEEKETRRSRVEGNQDFC
ncbi:hypothetical protein RN001_008662 [Aquatica leii]|uniref:Uncharacterized protein n=1 Tax=Aquatica leii TaxID=1421715 RepID=A0AAN7S9S8_9COLE|nr:hypothetical protein RN001_008662 [Aquatica leii]